MSYKDKVRGFLKSHKNGTIAAVAILDEGIRHMLEHRDWTQVARLVQGVEPRMAQRMRQIIALTVGGIKGAVDPKAEFGYRFTLAPNSALTDKAEELAVLVSQKVSIYSEEVDKFLGLEQKAGVPFDLAKRAASIASAAKKAGISEKDILDAVALAYRAVKLDPLASTAVPVVGEPAF